MGNAFTKLTQKSNMIIQNGNAVINVMVCNAYSTYVFNNISAKMANKVMPQLSPRCINLILNTSNSI
jgi:hypothetical protein